MIHDTQKSKDEALASLLVASYSSLFQAGVPLEAIIKASSETWTYTRLLIVLLNIVNLLQSRAENRHIVQWRPQ